MSGYDETTRPAPDRVRGHRLLRELIAAIRPQFRAEVLRLDAADPVFGGPVCRVPDCPRPARSRGVCSAHHARWRHAGQPDLDEFVATTNAQFARARLTCCQVPGCRYGVNGHGLCGQHLGVWRRAGRPELSAWLAATAPVAIHRPRVTLRVPTMSSALFAAGLTRQRDLVPIHASVLVVSLPTTGR